MNHLLYRVRRTLLRVLVPEFVWPRHVTVDGASIRVRHAPYSFGVKRILTRDEYETDERRFLSAILHPGDVVIEMGGSIGIVTAIIAARVGPGGFVVSVEASESLTAYSRTWLESGRNVKVVTGFGFPVARLERTVEIRKFEEQWGSMSGRVTFDVKDQASQGDGQAQAPLYDIERLSRLAPRPPATLVADIEGSESIIGQQPPAFPATLRNILIELHPDLYGEATMAAVIGRIEAEGFSAAGRQGNVFLFVRDGAPVRSAGT